jgi:pyruvate dehydrogenase E2 component (dihydrolipoamide acetyltransferase)
LATSIKMPDLGTTVDTVVLMTWMKGEGDKVKRGDILCEVETDKAVTELESVASGVLLRHVVPAGEEIAVGDVIAYVGEPGEALPDTDAGPTTESDNASPGEPVAQNTAGNAVSPLIRNLAERLGVDLSTVDGTGPGGRITREDVQRVNDAR